MLASISEKYAVNFVPKHSFWGKGEASLQLTDCGVIRKILCSPLKKFMKGNKIFSVHAKLRFHSYLSIIQLSSGPPPLLQTH